MPIVLHRPSGDQTSCLPTVPRYTSNSSLVSSPPEARGDLLPTWARLLATDDVHVVVELLDLDASGLLSGLTAP